MIVVNAEKFYRNIQAINPLMGGFVLPIKIHDRDEHGAGFQDSVNLFQRLWNIAVVIERLHGKRVGKFIVVERQLLSAGYFEIALRKRSRSFTREINHLIRDVDAL